jgi:SulP family sulfate permease
MWPSSAAFRERGSYSDIERNPDNEAVPGALLCRVEAVAALLQCRACARCRLATDPLGPRTLTLAVLRSVHFAHGRSRGRAHAGEAAQELQAAGIRLRLVAAHAAVRDILRAEGLEESVGDFGRRITVADVIDEFQARLGA